MARWAAFQWDPGAASAVEERAVALQLGGEVRATCTPLSLELTWTQGGSEWDLFSAMIIMGESGKNSFNKYWPFCYNLIIFEKVAIPQDSKTEMNLK